MNFTPESSDIILTRLTSKAVEQRIPTIVFIGGLSIIGLLGNIHVLIIFTRTDRKPSTYTVFVKALSIVDLITCIVHMPIEIVDLMKPYTFYSEVGCKLFRFINTFLLLSSASILVLIALERYRRVCKAFKRQMPVSVSKWLSFLVICICLIMTIPMYFLNGHRLVQIEENGMNVTGYVCYISDKYYRSTFLYSYIGLIFIVFIISSSILLVAYYSICRVVFGREANLVSIKTSCKKMRLDVYAIPVLIHASNGNQKPAQKSIDIFQHLSERNKKRLKSSTLRTTRTLVFITAIFIVVFAPYFILNFVNSLDKKFKVRLSNAELTLYQIGVRLIFINNVANPFVYGFIDKHFKNGFKKLYCNK